MKIVSLRKLVEENDVQEITRELEEGVFESFKVDSPDYREVQNYLVKGEYELATDPVTMKNVLKVKRLEKDFEVTLNRPVVVAEDIAPEEEEQLEAFINTPVTVVVFHRATLQSASRQTQKRHVTAFAQSVLESWQKTKGEAVLADFAVIEIDFENKALALKSIADVPPFEQSTVEA